MKSYSYDLLQEEHKEIIREGIKEWGGEETEILKLLFSLDLKASKSAYGLSISMLPYSTKFHSLNDQIISIHQKIHPFFHEYEVKPTRISREVYFFIETTMGEYLEDKGHSTKEHGGSMSRISILRHVLNVLDNNQFVKLEIAEKFVGQFNSFVRLTDQYKYMILLENNNEDGMEVFVKIYNHFNQLDYNNRFLSISNQPLQNLTFLDEIGVKYCKSLMLYLPQISDIALGDYPATELIQIVAPNLQSISKLNTSAHIEIYSDKLSNAEFFDIATSRLDNYDPLSLEWANQI